ncbi:hypothetical protein G9P44_004279 [Scheffersomyces stipitis]|nr:hypothetical protein G9P44_004279 [Scheffersomyces stipitis]
MNINIPYMPTAMPSFNEGNPLAHNGQMPMGFSGMNMEHNNLNDINHTMINNVNNDINSMGHINNHISHNDPSSNSLTPSPVSGAFPPSSRLDITPQVAPQSYFQTPKSEVSPTFVGQNQPVFFTPVTNGPPTATFPVMGTPMANANGAMAFSPITPGVNNTGKYVVQSSPIWNNSSPTVVQYSPIQSSNDFLKSSPTVGLGLSLEMNPIQEHMVQVQQFRTIQEQQDQQQNQNQQNQQQLQNQQMQQNQQFQNQQFQNQQLQQQHLQQHLQSHIQQKFQQQQQLLARQFNNNTKVVQQQVQNVAQVPVSEAAKTPRSPNTPKTPKKKPGLTKKKSSSVAKKKKEVASAKLESPIMETPCTVTSTEISPGGNSTIYENESPTTIEMTSPQNSSSNGGSAVKHESELTVDDILNSDPFENMKHALLEGEQPTDDLISEFIDFDCDDRSSSEDIDIDHIHKDFNDIFGEPAALESAPEKERLASISEDTLPTSVNNSSNSESSPTGSSNSVKTPKKKSTSKVNKKVLKKASSFSGNSASSTSTSSTFIFNSKVNMAKSQSTLILDTPSKKSKPTSLSFSECSQRIPIFALGNHFSFVYENGESINKSLSSSYTSVPAPLRKTKSSVNFKSLGTSQSSYDGFTHSSLKDSPRTLKNMQAGLVEFQLDMNGKKR